jgi:hypothetical protein
MLCIDCPLARVDNETIKGGNAIRIAEVRKMCTYVAQDNTIHQIHR